MRLRSYGFIVKGPGLCSDRHRAVFRSVDFVATIVGVSSNAEAEAAATRLADDGVQVVELCGGFDGGMLARIGAATAGAVPVGLVQFTGEDVRRLEALLAEHAEEGGMTGGGT
jgi:hypothetical protein